MKEVLVFIEKKKQEFARTPFMKFLQDKSIDPRQRLAWMPAFAHFAMSFKDFSRTVLRKEPSDSKIQEIINQHSYKDGRYWAWFLKDMKLTGYDNPINYTDALKFLWGEETIKVRQMAYGLFAICTFEEDILMKLVVVESIEATLNVALYEIAQIAKELQQITKQHHPYFGGSHFAKETGQIQAEMDDVEYFVENIQLTAAQKEKAFVLVEKVFVDFTESMGEVMMFAQKHSNNQHFTTTAGDVTTDKYPTDFSKVKKLLVNNVAKLELQINFKQENAKTQQYLETSLDETVKLAATKSIFPSIPKLNDIFNFIEAHYHQSISLRDVASSVGYSAAYLTDLVRRETGQSVHRWITKRRMAAACLLLKDSDLSIDCIAEKVGYSNRWCFFRNFRNSFGMTPGDWRSQERSSITKTCGYIS
jgi:AraC-like DNA-binding protein